MRKLSENEIKKVSGGDGNDGQAELIAIGAIAGTFLSPGIGSCSGQLILATRPDCSWNSRSDSFGVKPPLYQ